MPPASRTDRRNSFRSPADRVPEVLSEESRRRHVERDQRKAAAFLKGPIPLPWLQAAARLDGKALQIGVAIWYRVGLERSRTVRLSASVAEAFGVSRQARYRALGGLESAGLIRQEKASGRSPSITVLDVPPDG